MYKTLLNLSFILFGALSFSQSNTSLGLNWKNRSPSNIGGITSALLWDKNNENIIYAGGIAGGLFKSEDKGESWYRLDSYKTKNPSIASITQSISGTIFVGTGFTAGSTPSGTLYNYSFSGDGIFKSNDQGNTWTSIIETDEDLSPTPAGEWSKVGAIAAHPTNTNLLLAGNNDGIRVSVNAEASQPSFINALGVGTNVTDIQFTEDGKEAWVAAEGKLYHSTDLTNNFTNFNLNTPINGARAQLALSSVDNNGNYTIYASFTSFTGCLLGIYKSVDKGLNWTLLSSTGSQDPFQNPSGGCQGWYSHTIAVNPNNKDIIYVGGVSLYTFTTQGNFVQIDDILNESATDFLPNGKHHIIFNPFNAEEMLLATDLGIYMSSNALSGHPYNISYTSKNNNLNNINAINAGFGKNGDILISGLHNTHYIDYSDLNEPYYARRVWNNSNATAAVSNYEESVFLFSGYYGLLRKSINYGNSFFPFLDSNIDPANCGHITCDNLTPGTNCDYSLYMGIGYYNENLLYESNNSAKFFVPTACNNRLYVCTNPLSLTDAPIYSSFEFSYITGINDMDISADGDRFVYVSGSQVGITDGFNSFTPSFPDDITTNIAQIDTFYVKLNSIGFNNISGVSIDKNNKDHIIVVEDGYGSTSKVAKTIDGGLTWNIIHNNLPEIPIYDCIIDANNSSNYILATLEGIYTSNDAGNTWNEDNLGIGKVPIFRIKQEWVLEEDCYVLLASAVGAGVYTSTTLTQCNKNVEEEVWGLFNSINSSNNQQITLNIYPNPTQANFQIEIIDTDFESKTIRIFDVLGKQIYSGTIEDSLEVPTTNWTSGIYYISIANTFTKVIVQ